MYDKSAMTCFKYETITMLQYALSGYRASTMSTQATPPPPQLKAALPHFVWHHYLHPFS
jgi:hypothetical protein